MASSIPIPTSRVSGLLAQQRLVQQLQSDQLELFRLQDQISTGRRINLPSDDAPAALRAITLQRLLERKDQIGTNIASGQSFLAATDTALGDVADILSAARADSLGVAGTTSSQEERDSIAESVGRALEQLVTTGNRQFRGRYLFAGSQTNEVPYDDVEGLIAYRGDDTHIRNYSDVDVLFNTNATGQEVFGGLSSQVSGTADLNPQLNIHTKLSTLREGRGISANGSIAVSDGTNISIVDLTNASTVGDVARLIEASPPFNREVRVEINGGKLSVQLDALGGGNLTITEVGSGRTATELGLLEETGVGIGQLVGRDLNPVITKITSLDDLLGSKATTRLTSAGRNNDIIVNAAANGTLYEGARIQIVDDQLRTAAAGLPAGSEFAEFDANARAAYASLKLNGSGNDLTVTANTAGEAYNGVKIFVVGQSGLGDAALASYDATNKRLTVTIDDAGATTVQRITNAIDGTGQFTATHDNAVEVAYVPTAAVDASNIANVIGDTGNSGGNANTLYVYAARNATNANHIVAAINAEGTFEARVDQLDTVILAQEGTGLVATDATATASGGTGETLDLTSGVRVVNGKQTFTLDFSEAKTIEDLLNVFNESSTGLKAEINADGDGINVSTILSGGDFQIGENGGTTATQLGIRSFTEATKLSQLNYGVGVPANDGTDFTLTTQDAGGLDVTLEFDFSSVTTIGEAIDLINNHPSNNAAGVAIRAQLSAVGNGIELIDENPTGTGDLTVAATFGHQTAEYLGLLGEGETTVTTNAGTLTGDDRLYLETESTFTTLVRLQEALRAGDVNAIGRALETIKVDISRVTSARSVVGARQQGLDVTQRTLEDEDVQLRSALSNEIDVDLVEAISSLTARQSAMEASLRSSANLMQLSLLDFI